MPDALTRDGLRIAYHDLGGSGPELLMAHATGFHGHIWQPVADHLDGDFHCWALDIRGHGHSEVPPDGDFAWTHFVDDVLAVLGALGLERPVALGHSMGAATLLMTEQRHPGTFAGLWLYEPAIATPAHLDGVDGPDMVGATLRRRARFASVEEARANYAAKPPMDDFAPEALDAYLTWGLEPDAAGGVALRCRPTSEAAVFAQFPFTDVYRRLGEVSCPVTLVHGSMTKGGQDEDVRDQAARLADGRVQVLEGLSHLGPMQDPGLVARAIAGVLASPA